MKKIITLFAPVWPPHAFRFGGGGPTGAQQVAAAATPAAAAPASMSSPDVVQAQQDLRRQALQKRGFTKTIFAQDTGGWHPLNTQAPSPGKPALPSLPSDGRTKL